MGWHAPLWHVSDALTLAPSGHCAADDAIFTAPNASTRVPGVPLSVYSITDLTKILKESKIVADGCFTRDQMVERIQHPGAYQMPADWLTPE